VTSDEQSIRDLVASWHRNTATGNVDAVLPLMTDDVVFLVAGQSAMRGRSVFANGLRALLKTYRIESEFTIEEIEISNALAYCWTTLKVSIIPLAGGPAVLRTGPALSVLHKQLNGSWAIVRDANLLALAP
jgi:uncharacterized protein (TIGR02246 family)